MGARAACPPATSPIVVDNGSADGSGELAERLGAQVVREPRRGFGAACWAGLPAAARPTSSASWTATASFDPRELPRVADPVARGVADLVLGARAAAPGAWPAHARVANAALAWELRRRARVPLRDLGPMRAARREPLLALGIADRRFGWPLEMVLRAAAAGWRIDEVRVTLPPARRALEGDRDGARDRARGARHGGGADVSADAARDREGARAPGA